MKTTQARIQLASLPSDYASLCRLLMPRRIHDKVDLANVTEITDVLAKHFRVSADLFLS